MSQAAVSAEEEQARLIPVIEGILKASPHAVLSVDTYKAETARAALAAGTEVINDVSGFTWDEFMPAVCSASGCGVVLMHTRGRPEEWRLQPMLPADALVEAIRAGLAESLGIAARAGIAAESIVLDPGYGFGKKARFGLPILVSVSRKSFLGHTLSALHGREQTLVTARENASIAALVTAILHGASMVRVHDVRPAVEAACIADAVLAAG